jgi:hypothetical protein
MGELALFLGSFEASDGFRALHQHVGFGENRMTEPAE